ncbi:hypothetical protein J2Y54_003165 [Sphingomonas sp. BE123]|nr:hypothetical protein [Sphingomonas sp. BE123]
MPSLQNQKGAGVSASPPVSPSACWPIRETGALRRRQTVFRVRQGSAERCVPTVAMRPLAGHRDGGGSEEPRSRLDVLAIPSCLAAFRHRGPVIDRHDPRRVVSFDHLASVPLPKGFGPVAAVAAASRPPPKALPLHHNPLHPVRRRALRPGRSARSAARRHRPLPVRLSSPALGERCHWTPVRSVRAWSMRTSSLRFPGVASPSRSTRFPEGTCIGQAVTNI